MSAYIASLKAATAAEHERADQERAEQQRSNVIAARERLTPLEKRLGKLLDTIPPELQSEGLSLPSLQALLRGRSRGNCHPGELGQALRQLGFRRVRRWKGAAGFNAVWRR